MTTIKKPYHHGDLRRTLIETALAMLDENEGWHFTLREVARRAEVSHAAPYKHFPDKAALLIELADHGFRGLRAALLKAQGSSIAPRDEFLEMARAYVRFGLDNASLYSLMFSADARLTVSVEMTEDARASLDVLIDLVQKGQGDGWLRKRDVRVHAMACWAQLHGITLLAINGLLTREEVDRTLVDATLAVLFEGMET